MTEPAATMPVDLKAFSDLGLSLGRLRALTMSLDAAEFFEHLEVPARQHPQHSSALTMLHMIFDEARVADRLVGEAERKAKGEAA